MYTVIKLGKDDQKFHNTLFALAQYFSVYTGRIGFILVVVEHKEDACVLFVIFISTIFFFFQLRKDEQYTNLLLHVPQF